VVVFSVVICLFLNMPCSENIGGDFPLGTPLLGLHSAWAPLIQTTGISVLDQL